MILIIQQLQEIGTVIMHWRWKTHSNSFQHFLSEQWKPYSTKEFNVEKGE